jgi:cyclophilin family peptidyl-prolyl cis-trans isomerase
MATASSVSISPARVGDLARVERVDQLLADVLVHLGEHVAVEDVRERCREQAPVVAVDELEQIGDVGRDAGSRPAPARVGIASWTRSMTSLTNSGFSRSSSSSRSSGCAPDMAVAVSSMSLSLIRPLHQAFREAASRVCISRLSILEGGWRWATAAPTCRREHPQRKAREGHGRRTQHPGPQPQQRGDVVIRLRPDLAPGHVARIKSWSEEGFYDGSSSTGHPRLHGPGGDPTGSGMGGSNKPNLKAEFSREPHVRGTASMARSQNPDSANSQFFICFDDASASSTTVHRLGPGDRRHGACRRPPPRRAAARAGQDRQGLAEALTVGRRATLVTGASAGLGAEFARQCRRRGDELVLVARRRDRLEALAAELGSTHVLAADLTEPGAPARLLAEVAGLGLHVDTLINNAGFGAGGRFAAASPERLLEMIDLNVRALTELSPARPARMIERSVAASSTSLPRPLSRPGRTWPSIMPARPMCSRSPRRSTRR